MDQERQDYADEPYQQPRGPRRPTEGCATSCLILAIMAAVPLLLVHALFFAMWAGCIHTD